MTITDQELDEPVKAACEAWADAWDRENAARGISAKPLREYGAAAWRATEICMREALRAALLSVEQGRGWRPIETAPKDGSPVIVWQPDHGQARNHRSHDLDDPTKLYDDWRFAIGYWRPWGGWGNRNSATVTPTCWHALPPPPEPK